MSLLSVKMGSRFFLSTIGKAGGQSGEANAGEAGVFEVDEYDNSMPGTTPWA